MAKAAVEIERSLFMNVTLSLSSRDCAGVETEIFEARGVPPARSVSGRHKQPGPAIRQAWCLFFRRESM